MYDEEYFPVGHPLQVYLKNIDLSDECTKKQSFTKPFLSKIISFFEVVGFLLSRFLVTFSSVPFITEHIKFSIIKKIRLSGFLPCDKEIEAFLHSTAYDSCRRDLRICFVLYVLCASIWICAAQNYLSSALFGVLLLPTLISAITILFTKIFVYGILHYISTLQKSYREVLNFLQAVDVHCNFGPLISETANSLCYPVLHQHLFVCMSAHVIKLIEISVLFIDSFPPKGIYKIDRISRSELLYLRKCIELIPKDVTIVELKMLNELSRLVGPDLLYGLFGTLCEFPANSVLLFFRLNLLLGNWMFSLNKAANGLRQLVELKSALEHGKIVDDKVGFKECIKGSKSEIVTYNSASRLTHDLLMHLLISVQKTKNLEVQLTGQSSANIETSELVKNIMEQLQCQLNACMIFWNELKVVLLPLEDLKSSNLILENSSDQDTLYTQLKDSKNVATAINAKDPLPEDEVLEDVASGDLSENFLSCDTVGSDEFDYGTHLTARLHGSVLQELKNVILYRRLLMEKREQAALLRRRQNELRSSTEPFIEEDSKNVGKHQTLTNTNDSELLNTGNQIDQFFPTNIHQKQELTVRRPHNLRILQAKVSNRSSMFDPSIHIRNNFAEANDGSIVSLDSSGELSINNEQGVSNRSTFSTALSIALQAQRKKLGFMPEYCFTGIGLGDESLVDLNKPSNKPST